MKLEINNVTCGYGSKSIIKDVSMEIKSGETLCLLGPNGVGKTTFFKTILGFLKIQKGKILINNKNIYDFTNKELAKKIGYVPQAHNPPFPFKVIDVILMGRNAHIGAFSSPTKKDMQIAEESLETLNIVYLRDKVYTEISGGEKQLVLIARALTQQPEFLIMDEPTSNLDFGNQVLVLKKVNGLVKKGLGVIMTSHFPNHVFLSASKVAIFRNGEMIDIGVPENVITEKCLKETYGIGVKIIDANVSKDKIIKVCVPIMN